MTLITTAPEAPFHRLARNHVHSRRRSLLGTGYVIVAWLVLGGLVLVVGDAIARSAGRPTGPEEMASFGPLWDVALMCLAIAALLPVTLSAARWIQRRHAGGLSSVAGRLRWRWLLSCLGVAVGTTILSLGGGTALMAATGVDADTAGYDWVGAGPFLLTSAVLLLVVPLQSAAEEYGFRGWLLQALGSAVRRPWLPIGVQAVLFAAMHGWGTPWGFADLVVFGVVTGWLTIRTGGIEAAVALHVANNALAFVAAGAFGALSGEQTTADAGWQAVAADAPVLIVYALIIAWLARRRNPAVMSPPAPVPVSVPGAATYWAAPPAVGAPQPGHPARL